MSHRHRLSRRDLRGGSAADCRRVLAFAKHCCRDALQFKDLDRTALVRIRRNDWRRDALEPTTNLGLEHRSLDTCDVIAMTELVCNQFQWGADGVVAWAPGASCTRVAVALVAMICLGSGVIEPSIARIAEFRGKVERHERTANRMACG